MVDIAQNTIFVLNSPKHIVVLGWRILKKVAVYIDLL